MDFKLATTVSDAEDAERESGWTIGDNAHDQLADSANWKDMRDYGENIQWHSNLKLRIRVKGYLANSKPIFLDTDYPHSAVSRGVKENVTSGDVGDPITATDAETDDTLTYSVAATDATDAAVEHWEAFIRDFELDVMTGQISVKSEAVIDFETRPSYKVLYQVTDSKDAASEADPAIDDTLTLTVTVTDADDPGIVTFDANPVAGTLITASLTEDDTVSGTPRWTWERSQSRDSGFVAISGATNAAYRPVDGDHGYYLRANVAYTGEFGAIRSSKQASAVTENRVNELTLVSNWGQLPDVPLQTFLYELEMDPGFYEGRFCLAQSFTADSGTSRAYLLSQVEFGSKRAVHSEHGLALDNYMTLRIRLDNAGIPSGSITDGNEYAFLDRFEVSEGSVALTRIAVPAGTAMADGSTLWLTACASQHLHKAGFAMATTDYNDEDVESESGWTIGDGVYQNFGDSFDWSAAIDAGTNTAFHFTSSLRLRVKGYLVNTAPAFADADSTVTRRIAENTASGRDVGAPVTATDAEMDTLTYSVVAADGVTDAADHLGDFIQDFVIDASGQISVKRGAMIDYEDRSSYTVTYRVTDSKRSDGYADTVIDDTLTLTIEVDNVDEEGTLTLGAAPKVGTAFAATLDDPDTVVGARWQWQRSYRPGIDFQDIIGADSASYTPVKNATTDDSAYFLRAIASYTDGEGPGKTLTADTALPVDVSAGVLMKNTGQQPIESASISGAIGQRVRSGDNPGGYLVTGASMFFADHPSGRPLQLWTRRDRGERLRLVRIRDAAGLFERQREELQRGAGHGAR